MAGLSALPHRLVAQALLWAADAVANEQIARRLLVDSDTVSSVAEPVRGRGIAGAGAIAEGRGRKSCCLRTRGLGVDPGRSAPAGATTWTTRSLAVQVGVRNEHGRADLVRSQAAAVAGRTLSRSATIRSSRTSWSKSLACN